MESDVFEKPLDSALSFVLKECEEMFRPAPAERTTYTLLITQRLGQLAESLRTYEPTNETYHKALVTLTATCLAALEHEYTPRFFIGQTVRFTGFVDHTPFDDVPVGTVGQIADVEIGRRSRMPLYRLSGYPLARFLGDELEAVESQKDATLEAQQKKGDT